MLNQLLLPYIGQAQLNIAYAVIAFVLTTILLRVDLPFLPKDQGRPNAVNGELSKGKTRGVGLVMMICFVLTAALFLPFSLEFMFFALLILAEMFSGYLDDASKTSWSDYKKGAIDFVISLLVGVVFVLNNPTTIYFGAVGVTLHPILYGALATILVWMSINAVNCTDGVDGLSGTVGLVSILSFLVIYPTELCADHYEGYILLLAAIFVSYLLFNAGPSKVLMGDAGSRPLGVLLAILAMKTQHPLCYLLLCGVFIADGLTGLVKIFFLRFFKIHFFKNTRTPLHDHVRKNRGWSDTQVVIRFAIIQLICSAVWFITTL